MKSLFIGFPNGLPKDAIAVVNDTVINTEEYQRGGSDASQ